MEFVKTAGPGPQAEVWTEPGIQAKETQLK